MKVEIVVTQEHIDKGRRGSICSCPIALAACEAMDLLAANVRAFAPPECTGATLLRLPEPKIGLCLCRKSGGWERAIVLPREAFEFVAGFDDGLPVEPFAFTIDVPEATEPTPA